MGQECEILWILSIDSEEDCGLNFDGIFQMSIVSDDDFPQKRWLYTNAFNGNVAGTDFGKHGLPFLKHLFIVGGSLIFFRGLMSALEVEIWVQHGSTAEGGEREHGFHPSNIELPEPGFRIADYLQGIW